MKKYGGPIHKHIKELGTTFRYIVDSPEQEFQQHGYEVIERVSPIKETMKAMGAPEIIINTFFKGYLSGNFVYLFKYRAASSG